MNNDKAIKLKLTLGYLILGITAILSVWYIFNEVKVMNEPKEELISENNKVLNLGSIITNIYTADSSGRVAMISTDKKDIQKYHQLVDTIQSQIVNFKTNVTDDEMILKLDTIQSLIREKEKSFDEIVAARKKFMNSQYFDEAFKKVRAAKDDIENIAVNVSKDSTSESKEGFWKRIRNVVDSEKKEKEDRERQLRQQQQLNKIHQSKRDSLAKMTENIFSQAIDSENKLAKEFYQKEEQLINENRHISEKIKSLMIEVEKSVLENSYSRINFSNEIIDKTAINLAWIGGIGFLMVIILGGVVLRDLNKSRAYKKQLERLNKDLQNLMEQKSYFLASVTHDINSPLNSLIGFSELLDETLKTKTQKEYIKNINYSSQYIRNLVNDLVDFSKLEYNKMVLKKESFNFNELLLSITTPLKNDADKKGIELIANVDPKLDDYFFSDPYRIKQILTNILSNGIKFTDKGSVTLEAVLNGNEAVLKITDTGIGIDEKYHKDIFMEFKQAHGDIEKVYGGTGLGLNISKRLIKLLQGELTFESRLDKGSIFTIRIPVEKGENNQFKNMDIVFDNEKKLIHKNILVVDDDMLQLRLMNEVIKDKVNLITTLKKGELIEEYLNENKYNLIITDIQMPNYSGYKIIQAIRSNPEYKNTPVIAFTGKIDLDENEISKLGFNALLQKPINIPILMNTIHRLLEINREQKPVNPTSKMQIKNEYFDLEQLLSFTQDDLDATQDILNVFIDSSIKNCDELSASVGINDRKKIAEITHRMLPMFRQLSADMVIADLEKLERYEYNGNAEELKEDVVTAVGKIQKIIEELKKIELF